MNLTKRIAIYTAVGFLFLAFTPECKKRYDARCLRKEKYNKAKLKVEQLADTNNNGKLDETERRAVKIRVGIDPRSTSKLELLYLEDYLGQEGFAWNGKNYIKNKKKL